MCLHSAFNGVLGRVSPHLKSMNGAVICCLLTFFFGIRIGMDVVICGLD